MSLKDKNREILHNNANKIYHLLQKAPNCEDGLMLQSGLQQPSVFQAIEHLIDRGRIEFYKTGLNVRGTIVSFYKIKEVKE